MSKKSLGFSKSSHIHFGSIENNKDASLQPQYDFKSNNDLVLDNGGDKLFTAIIDVPVLAGTTKPIFTNAQVITQLTTSWSTTDTSVRLWAAPATPAVPLTSISYGINTTNPTNFTAFGAASSPEGAAGSLVAMTALQVSTARLSFRLWDDLISTTLVESGGAGANITLNYSSATSGNGTYSSALTYNTVPNKAIAADQIWLASNWATNQDSGMVNGGYGFQTMMHEIGHSLGLSHPGTYNAAPGVAITYAANAVFAQDNRQFTIMSYFGGYNPATGTWALDGTSASYTYSQTPMVYDIAAIQALYGADTTTRTGDTVYGYNCNFVTDAVKDIYNFSVNLNPIFTIYDAAGANDALDCSGWATNQAIDLTPGSYSSVRGLNYNVGIAFNTTIEKAVGGAGNDTLKGNDAANTLIGGAGIDTMQGGLGSDTYEVTDVGDVVTEGLNEGTDTTWSYIANYTLAANVEQLVLGGTAAINGTGNALDNALTGNAAANILDGGLGIDAMTGGLGDDTYYVDNAGDTTIETVGGGNDIVFSQISYNLGAEIEQLRLYGALSTVNVGNALNNIIYSADGNNSIDGAGGIDTVSYQFATAGVNANLTTGLVTGGAGSDTLTNIENLQGSAFADTLAGNAGANALASGQGNDTLDGGAGIDTLTGGLGDDTFIVDLTTVNQLEDSITELAAGGIDTVTLRGGTALAMATTITLAAELENLNAANIGAAILLNLTGNTGNNVLTGNAAANILIGGLGIDTMSGGLGNDIYVVAEVGDLVVEAAGAGADTVWSALADYILADNVETLNLGGAGNFNGRGNADNNLINGNTGNNILIGGAGIDTMQGGLGSDTYEVTDVGDVVTEGLNEGTDTTWSYIANYTLAANVEQLVLGGTAAINGTGNALNNLLIGNVAANTLNGGAGNDTLDGGLGADTTSYTNTIGAVTVNLTNNTATDGYGGTDTLLNIENLIGGAFNDTLTGNAAANYINGWSGADAMAGGDGNDHYVVDNISDTVSETNIDKTIGGTDIVEAHVTYTLSANVENLTLAGAAIINGFGNALSNSIIGNGAANVLEGGVGDDTINGGLGGDTIRGGAGTDSMTGGAGNDVYEVTDATDTVIEILNDGTDTVFSGLASYLLASNVENLTLGGGAVNGTGNDLGNLITGNIANNILDGGAGIDTLTGGTGDDAYIVDLTMVNQLEDSVTEVALGGVDTINLRAGTGVAGTLNTLTLGAEIENLNASAALATALLNLTGNASNNALTGNAANNFLIGDAGNDSLIGGAGNDTLSGGTGNDTMDGGAGDDLYGMDVATDVILADSSGIDTVNVNWTTAGTYSIAARSDLENIAVNAATTVAINVTGNALNNFITGNAGANILDGGAGVDVLTGGLGDDIFIVDLTATNVLEDTLATGAVGDGIDTLKLRGGTALATVSTIILAAELENLDASATLSTALLNLAGNAANNVLTGNAANNVLNGNAGNDTMTGGLGLDTFTGGLGSDIFDFNFVTESLASASRDVITDFSSIQFDKIDFLDIDANVSLIGDQAFLSSILTSGAFTAEGQLRIVGNILSGNTDSNFATSEFEIFLTGVSTLTSLDFIL